MPRWILLEFQCRDCGDEWDSLEDRDAMRELAPCERCAGPGFRILSPVRMMSTWAAPVTRGRPDPVPPGAMDTEPLADGMPYGEWKARLAKERRDRRRAQIRRLMT